MRQRPISADRRTCGCAIVAVRALDYTAMYPTIFCLQRLDNLLTAPEIKAKVVTAEMKALVGKMATRSALLFESKICMKVNCLLLGPSSKPSRTI